jgi:cell division protein ZapA
MPLVNVLVNSHAYTLACDEGEEAHLRELAQFLDKRVRELAGAVGQVGDTRLLLMAGLLVSDELAEALSTIEERDSEIAKLKESAGKGKVNAASEEAAEARENAAARIEAIAARVSRS